MRIRTAFVLGAGLGTRLRPLTLRLPKPLVPVLNMPLVTHAFDHLIGVGIERFVVNTHWLSGAWRTAFPDSAYRERPIVFVDEQPEVLETAGGLWNARDHFHGEPVLVYNGDILSDLPLRPALAAHLSSGREVTLVLRSFGAGRNVTFDADKGVIRDLRRVLEPDLEPQSLFTGIYLVDPEFIARIPAGQKLSVVPIFHDMIREGKAPGGVVVDEGSWWDLGSRAEYLAVHKAMAPSGLIHPSARIHESALLNGATVVGENAEIGEGAVLEDSIVWPGARVAAGATLSGCVVADTAGPGVFKGIDFAA